MKVRTRTRASPNISITTAMMIAPVCTFVLFDILAFANTIFLKSNYG
jgi:hypothetical protein